MILSTILCLETTTTNCSVAIGFEGKLQILKEDNSKGYSHAEKLHVFINEALREANLTLDDLDAIAVSKGPGSYTGLRIGVSAAKGLCFALDIPLLAIDTLQSLAHQAENGDTIIPMLDARRMEVYTAIFSSENELMSPVEAKILDENSYSEYLNNTNQVTFIGTGVAKFKEICDAENTKFIEALPSAREMVNIAYEKHKISDTENVAYFEPYYLKDFRVSKPEN